jgi:hypothetical protein
LRSPTIPLPCPEGYYTLQITSTANPEDADWLTLRAEFIPEEPLEVQRVFLRRFARESFAFRAFVARDEETGLLGFAEVAVPPISEWLQAPPRCSSRNYPT